MRDKSRIPKLKSLMASTSSVNAQSQRNDSLAIVTNDVPLDVVMEDAQNGSNDPKNAPM